MACVERLHEMPASAAAVAEARREGVRFEHGWGASVIEREECGCMDVGLAHCLSLTDETGAVPARVRVGVREEAIGGPGHSGHGAGGNPRGNPARTPGSRDGPYRCRPPSPCRSRADPDSSCAVTYGRVRPRLFTASHRGGRPPSPWIGFSTARGCAGGGMTGDPAWTKGVPKPAGKGEGGSAAVNCPGWKTPALRGRSSGRS